MTIKDAIEFMVLGALWGASFLFMRVASPEFGPVPLVAIRITIAALLLLSVLAARRGLGELRGRLTQLTLLGSINSAIPFVLFAYATLSLPAGFTSVLNATAPLLGALLGLVLFKDALGARRLVALVAGLAGVLILVSGKLARGGDGVAILAGLCAALGYAAAAHYTKRTLAGVPPLVIAAGSMAGAAVILIPPAVVLWPDRAPSDTALNVAISLGIGCTGIAYILYFRLIERIGAVKAVAVAYLIPVFGTAWGALILGEAITSTITIGGLVILTSTVLLNASRRPTPR